MKTVSGPFVLFAAALALTPGCVVCSVHPWLTHGTRVSEPSLAGSWTDAKNKLTATFVSRGSGEYRVTLVETNGADKGQRIEYAATLHAIEGTYLLDVTATDDRPTHFALLPVHLLLKADLTARTVKIYPLAFEGAGNRLTGAGLILASRLGMDKDAAWVVGSETPALEGFVRRNLRDAAFFAAEPFWALTRTGAGP